MLRFCSHPLPLAAIAAACLLAAPAAMAQSANSWMVRLGAARVAPDVKSGNLSAPNFGPGQGTQIDVGAANQIGGGITYMVTDHVAIDVPLALPLKHPIYGEGAISGVGRIGTIKGAPATVLGQYRFMEPTSAFRPFVGAGITYARFYDQTMNGTYNGLTGGTPDQPTTTHTDSKFAPTIQAGLSYFFTEHWFIEGSVSKTWLKTTSHLSSGQSISYRLDPWGYQLSVGYKF